MSLFLPVVVTFCVSLLLGWALGKRSAAEPVRPWPQLTAAERQQILGAASYLGLDRDRKIALFRLMRRRADGQRTMLENYRATMLPEKYAEGMQDVDNLFAVADLLQILDDVTAEELLRVQEEEIARLKEQRDKEHAEVERGRRERDMLDELEALGGDGSNAGIPRGPSPAQAALAKQRTEARYTRMRETAQEEWDNGELVNAYFTLRSLRKVAESLGNEEEAAFAIQACADVLDGCSREQRERIQDTLEKGGMSVEQSSELAGLRPLPTVEPTGDSGAGLRPFESASGVLVGS